MKKTIKVRVAEMFIHCGERNSIAWNPIARACRNVKRDDDVPGDMLMSAVISTDENNKTPTGEPSREVFGVSVHGKYRGTLPKEVSDKLTAYNAGGKMEPFEFDMEIDIDDPIVQREPEEMLTLDLTKREVMLVAAALSYAYSNTDDINDALEDDSDNEGHVRAAGMCGVSFDEDEFNKLNDKLAELVLEKKW